MLVCHARTLGISLGALALGTIVLLTLNTPWSPAIAAPAAACLTSGPGGGAYSITLCVVNPSSGATLTGVTSVSATVTVAGSTPGIQKVVYKYNNVYLLTDFTSPFAFDWPTNKLPDGTHTFSAQVFANDGFQSTPVNFSITLHNGNTITPTNSSSFVPVTGTNPPAGQPYIVAAVGDGAGGETTAANVTDLIGSWNPNMFLYLGDVYDQGSVSEFQNWYAPSTYFGRFITITNPTVGIHEYLMAPDPSQPYAPAGYFDYWGQVPDWYSLNVGGWHLINLNTNCVDAGGCKAGSPQYNWLQNDLSTNASTPCTLVFYHTPYFDAGPEAVSAFTDTWALMASRGVDLVVNGNDHNYQRWVPLDGTGTPASGGITELIVGNGGHSLQTLQNPVDPRVAVYFDRTTSPMPFGALRLELYPNGTRYKFINTSGTVLDSSSLICSGASGPLPNSSLLYLPLLTR